MTPHEVFLGKKPNISRLEEFGIKCWAWKYYNTHSRHIQTSRNIKFDENDNHMFPIPSDDDDELPTQTESNVNPVSDAPKRSSTTETDKMTQNKSTEIQDLHVPTDNTEHREPRQSARIATLPRQDYQQMNDPNDNVQIASETTEQIFAPTNLYEAQRRADYWRWEDVMKTEIDQHNQIGTWEKCDLPEG
ncbi:hypothetical protein Clacol_009527 [Clathrus columnatus]|uniref:Uncharacterized protein n=1 Tax=Clathrus columnatus TaxID=1419009 RepID=A0AAV5AQT8_9AGAM|nr:hypothetical protein Clacol_009527 [Clathrus columnatus]